MEDKEVLKPREAGAYLGLSAKTLANFRSRGGGPVFVRMGGTTRGRIRYRLADLRAYVERQRRVSTDTDTAPKEG